MRRHMTESVILFADDEACSESESDLDIVACNQILSCSIRLVKTCCCTTYVLL